MLKTLLLPNLYLSKEKKDTIQDSFVPSAHVQQKTPYFADTPDHGICIQQQAALNELILNTIIPGFARTTSISSTLIFTIWAVIFFFIERY